MDSHGVCRRRDHRGGEEQRGRRRRQQQDRGVRLCGVPAAGALEGTEVVAS